MTRAGQPTPPGTGRPRPAMPARRSRAVVIGLAVIAVVDVITAVVYEAWWLLGVAAVLVVVLLTLRARPSGNE